ncbi:PREDICTED: pollen-specific leucine-rich repeat extensin-like protein 1 isoform X2 [Poecilia mexicana]|uniref:pollen-specific leucine-rich repeat extensin-like protein 1 isoform X2 n=1 Tax=Poecilia mexicana TaxID=48701 RepID=UPI00072EA62D|nr:PREDICTED: pollen-specific leucine-rich repeat extensin-like protein 1 isoform X2 [Poecilia mexicana]
MKVHLVLPVALLTSVILVGLLKIRKRDHDKEEKRSRFQDIKLRVTSDVLQEYQKEKAERQNELEKVQGELKAMEEEVKVAQTKAEKAAGDLTGCEGSQKSGADQQAAEETNLGNLKAQTEKETTEWNAELDRLKKQLTEKSPVCNFLKEYPDQIKTMCGIKEEPKAEPPKQEEKKEEPPKQEEKKEEPPKQEEKKAEPPKQEEKKAEPPKQEEKKAEPPKQEEKKEEPPKQEEKKEEPPKQEEKKEEPPKQ